MIGLSINKACSSNCSFIWVSKILFVRDLAKDTGDVWSYRKGLPWQLNGPMSTGLKGKPTALLLMDVNCGPNRILGTMDYEDVHNRVPALEQFIVNGATELSVNTH